MVEQGYAQGSRSQTEQGPFEFTERPLPEYIHSFFSNAAKDVQELQELHKVKQRMTLPPGQSAIYNRRIADLELTVGGAKRLYQAIRLGYDPITINDSWNAGVISPSDKFAIKPGKDLGIGLVFNVPMPGEVLEKYMTAKESGLFESFLVLSSDRSLFKAIEVKLPPLPMACEPLLVGFVKTEKEFYTRNASLYRADRSGNAITNLHSKFTFSGGTPLLIAQWDLSRDFAHMPK